MRSAWLAALLAAAGLSTAGQSPDLVRERRTVNVAGATEEWSLEWKAPPQPECEAGTAEASTCPCMGFAYGESGELDLVRRRAGVADERLELAPFFDGAAIVPRWPYRLEDDHLDRQAILARVHARREVRLIDFKDYDRDGQATEFFLQLESEPCGKLMGIAVGVSRARPALHALTSVAHPERPLILRIDQWQALAKTAGPFMSVALRCGDHASSEQYELTLAAAAGRINVTSRVYACDANDKKGRLLRTDVE